MDQQRVPLRDRAHPVDRTHPHLLVALLTITGGHRLVPVPAQHRGPPKSSRSDSPPNMTLALVAFQIVSPPLAPQRWASWDGDCTAHSMWIPATGVGHPAVQRHRSDQRSLIEEQPQRRIQTPLRPRRRDPLGRLEQVAGQRRQQRRDRGMLAVRTDDEQRSATSEELVSIELLTTISTSDQGCDLRIGHEFHRFG